MSIQTLKRDHEGLALILGARSWVGSCLTQELIDAGWVVIGTTSRDVKELAQHSNESLVFVNANSSDAVVGLISELQPDVVVNLRLGISPLEFEIHQAAASESEKVEAQYVYCSSALALDGYEVEEKLVEELPPRSNSAYGIFKGKCEFDLLQRTGLRSLVIRFSSIHGWSPWKDSRTVSLLKQICVGETVQVDQCVVQNRMSDKFLAETLTSLILKKSTGVAHIGTTDSSEEVEFLKRLANTFGFAGHNIYPGKIKPLNLAVIPRLGMHPSGPKTESDTLSDLHDRIELACYKNLTKSQVNG